jgi:DNA repair protein RadC
VTFRVTGQYRPEQAEIQMTTMTLFTADPHTSTGYREATHDEIMTAARNALNHKVRRGTGLTSPRVTRDFLIARLAELPYEVFTLIYLDNHCRFIAAQDLFRGAIDSATVHPREVVKEALKHNAAKVILAHVHPSGVAEPSKADEYITDRVKA